MRPSVLGAGLALCLTALVACGGQPAPTAAPAATSAPAAAPTVAVAAPVAAAPTAAPTTAPASTAAAKPPAPTAAAKPLAPATASPAASGDPTLKDLGSSKIAASVTSYRQKMVFTDKTEGVKPESASFTITEAWIKDPPAQHITMTGATAKDTIEMIQIGKDSYVSLGGQWMKASGESSSQAMGTTDLGSWMRDSDQKLVLVGTETVNGVKCKHYTYDASMPIRREDGVSLKAKGDVWIADEAPLTGMAVKEKSDVEYVGRTPKPQAKGNTGLMNLTDWTKASWERELSDVNKPITIKPPDNVMDLDTMLTPQATGSARAGSTPAAGPPVAGALRTATPVPTARATEQAAVVKGGLTWTKGETDADDSLAGVLMLGPGNGFAYGWYGDTLRLAGGKWTRFDLPEAEGLTIADAQAVDDKIIWAVGEQGLILRYDGSKWTRFQSPTEENLTAIGMSSDKDGWAGGANGTLLRFANNSWSAVNPSPIEASDAPTSIVMVPSTDGWMFGENGMMLRLKSGRWTDATSEREREDSTPNAVKVPGAKDVWTFGYGTAWRHDGATWAKVDVPTLTTNLTGAAFASATDGWAVGESGTILRWDGKTWAKWASPSKEDLEGVAIASNGEAWIVGSGPTVLKLNR